ncbi:hypothetical protein MJG53_015749 [Ovis ammon polii x Ovis aries]|uniref:Uncharacterized protein n=1 Tax=Ovis ammon polii x Ovis aries TaxID=2918886 RepID=A0ACB9UCV0_9CETA|nr:hypothetical protein MJG53_015749 [Ovis ammon polii x Ovis aries]
MKETSRQDRRHSSSGSSPRPSDGSPASALTCLSRLSLTATLSGKSSVSDGAHESILILRVSALPLVGGRWFLFGRSVGRSSLTAVQLLPVEDSEDISGAAAGETESPSVSVCYGCGQADKEAARPCNAPGRCKLRRKRCILPIFLRPDQKPEGNKYRLNELACETRDEKHRSTLFLLSICTDEQNGSDENSEKAVKLREFHLVFDAAILLRYLTVRSFIRSTINNNHMSENNDLGMQVDLATLTFCFFDMTMPIKLQNPTQ